MAKFSPVKKLILSDFPSKEQSWLTKLFQPLNAFLEQVVSALQNGLTIADNFKSQKWNLDIAVSQTYPIRLAYAVNERPTDVRIAYLIENSGSPAVPTAAYSCYWQYDNGTLQVTMIGLNSAKKYKITLIAQV